MEYNHVLLKMLNVSIFSIPYIGVWLFLIYKLKQLSTISEEYNNVFIFLAAVLFFSRLNYMSKPKHIVDEMIIVCHITIGCILYVYSAFLSFNFENDFSSVAFISVQLLFLYTFVFHSKKYIDPHFTVSDYLKVETLHCQDIDDCEEVIEANKGSDTLI